MFTVQLVVGQSSKHTLEVPFFSFHLELLTCIFTQYLQLDFLLVLLLLGCGECVTNCLYQRDAVGDW